MSRMNSDANKKRRGFLIARDGNNCFICAVSGKIKKLVIDHWDNDNSNNDPENLHLMCQSDNILKNPRGKSKKMSLVRVSELGEERINSQEYRKSIEAKPLFRHWVFQEVRNKKKLDYDEAINGGAEIADISQETAKRYLKRMCSEVGKMKLMKDEEGNKYVVQKTEKELTAIRFKHDEINKFPPVKGLVLLEPNNDVKTSGEVS